MATGTNTKKRFINIHIWDQPWFIDIDPDYKLLWFYMVSKCDNIGVYAHSRKKTKFEIGIDIETSEIEKFINTKAEKVRNIEDDELLIVDFCKFQHCGKSALLPKAKVIVSYMKDIRDAGLVDYFYECQPEVISDDSLTFFKAFERGFLEFKFYSDKKKKGQVLTEYQEALQYARKCINQSHSNGIPMTQEPHQGEGIGKSKRAGKGGGIGINTGSDQGSNNNTSPYYQSKSIAERLSRESYSSHELTTEVSKILKGLKDKKGIINPYNHIDYVLTEMEQYYPEDELTMNALKEKLGLTSNQ